MTLQELKMLIIHTYSRNVFHTIHRENSFFLIVAFLSLDSIIPFNQRLQN